MVKFSSKLKSWKIKPNFWERKLASSLCLIFVISKLAISTAPFVGLSIVDMTFNNVVFPEPDGPIIPTNKPSLIEKDNPFIAFYWFFPFLLYFLFFLSLFFAFFTLYFLYIFYINSRLLHYISTSI